MFQRVHMGPWDPGLWWWCLLDYRTHAVHIFCLVLKVLKLVLYSTIFSNCSWYESNWWRFTCEICAVYISRLIVPPASVVSYAYTVSCFFFSGYSGISVWTTLGWALFFGVHGLFNPQPFQYFRFIYLFIYCPFFSLVVRFYFFLFLPFLWLPSFSVKTYTVSQIKKYIGNLVLCNDMHCLSKSLVTMTFPFFLKF